MNLHFRRKIRGEDGVLFLAAALGFPGRFPKLTAPPGPKGFGNTSSETESRAFSRTGSPRGPA
jgi:hypothetical protein